MVDTIGILAYGSLISDPGPEIGPYIVQRIYCHTPFKVEFARKSRTRNGAPTLVPFEGGSQVAAQILVVDLPLKDAIDRLYRREIRKIGTDTFYTPGKAITSDRIIIEQIRAYEGIGSVLYTRIGSNIEELTATVLAELAIASAREQRDGSDGISYLISATKYGIQTPLSAEYDKEILRMTGEHSLEAALECIQTSHARSSGK